MSYTYEDNIISDLHKDAYGFRPSQRFFDDWAEYTPAEKQECWDLLIDAMKASQEQEAAAEAQRAGVAGGSHPRADRELVRGAGLLRAQGLAAEPHQEGLLPPL